jgi:uncharacterized protein (UPF0218 family)
MSGGPALDVGSAPRVLVVDGDGERTHDVFELVEIVEDVIRVRSPFLFEIGEELHVRIESTASPSNVTVRVRAHIGTADARVTELEILPVTS